MKYLSTSTKKKPRVVILESGWGGNRLARMLNKDIFDVNVVSPANHFLFTPLLPQTTVGSLEFRTIQEPVRTIEGLGGYYQAKARSVDLERRVVTCELAFQFAVGAGACAPAAARATQSRLVAFS